MKINKHILSFALKQMFFCIFMFCAYSLNAQSPMAYTLSGTKGSTVIKSYRVNNAGGMLMLGEFSGDSLFLNNSFIFQNQGNLNQFNRNYGDGFLIKTDNTGKIQYKKQMWGNGLITKKTSGQAFTYQTAEDDKGNVWVTGMFQCGVLHFGSDSINGTLGKFNLFLVKIDPNGDITWKKVFTIDQMSGQISAILPEFDGSITIAGSYYGNINIGTTILPCVNCSAEDMNVFLARLTPSGDLTWAKRIGSSSNDEVSSLAMDNYGHYYIAGTYSGAYIVIGPDSVTSSGNKDNTNIFLTQFDKEGHFKWTHSTTSRGPEYPAAVKTDSHGNCYLLANYSGDSMTFDNDSSVQNIAKESSFLLAKYNADGKLKWMRPVISDKASNGSDLLIDYFDNIIIAGNFTGKKITSGNISLDNATPGSQSVFLTDFDSTGNCVSGETFGPAKGGYPVALRQNLNNGQLYISDFTTSSQISIEGQVFTNKYPADSASGFSFIAPVSKLKLGVKPENAKTAMLAIYPNPNNGMFTINAGLAPQQAVRISVTDILGREIAIVHNGMLSQTSFKVNLNNHTNGIYFINFVSNTQTLTQRIEIIQ